ISPDGKFAYATHILGRYQMPTTQLERGWMNTNALSIVQIAEQRLVNSVLLDDVDLGAANPWGVACSADGRFICVAHAGTHEISLIDAAKLHERLDKVASGVPVTEVSQKPEDVPNDLSFLVGIRQRVHLPGNGPRGIACAGNSVFAAQYFTDNLGVVDLSPDARLKAQAIALGPEKEISVVRKGEMFFNDAGLCFQHWQSCESCHPDARSDALNWDLLNDGMGNPKNSKSMLYAHRTPPSMSLGIRDNAETAVRAGIKFIQFAVRPEEDAKAIDEYLKALTPVASPYAGEAAQRGKAVFEQAGCLQCHVEPLGTDLHSYEVGTETEMDKKPFDTPSLTEVWRTAPYLHDGRATTIMNVLTTFNKGDKHGKTSNLSQDQLKDLAAFVLSY
ncbi:MAG: c-type cytochrome, partial [Candidatus Hydrogenedentes bacterium]|nr:c-type cytochrome [Candidatus Hydrogenedentota bacterium]